jgi:hypothetical protein
LNDMRFGNHCGLASDSAISNEIFHSSDQIRLPPYLKVLPVNWLPPFS